MAISWITYAAMIELVELFDEESAETGVDKESIEDWIWLSFSSLGKRSRHGLIKKGSLVVNN